MRADQWGISISGICLLHCLILPVLAILTPSIGGLMAAQETITHWLLLGLALPVSTWSWLRGYRQHRSRGILMLGGLGLLLMLIAVSHLFGHRHEATLTIAGVILVAFGHIANIQLMHSAHQVPSESENGGNAKT